MLRTQKWASVLPSIIDAALTGPLFFRRWFSQEPLTDKFAKQIVERVIR